MTCKTESVVKEGIREYLSRMYGYISKAEMEYLQTPTNNIKTDGLNRENAMKPFKGLHKTKSEYLDVVASFMHCCSQTLTLLNRDMRVTLVISDKQDPKEFFNLFNEVITRFYSEEVRYLWVTDGVLRVEPLRLVDDTSIDRDFSLITPEDPIDYSYAMVLDGCIADDLLGCMLHNRVKKPQTPIEQPSGSTSHIKDKDLRDFWEKYSPDYTSGFKECTMDVIDSNRRDLPCGPGRPCGEEGYFCKVHLTEAWNQRALPSGQIKPIESDNSRFGAPPKEASYKFKSIEPFRLLCSCGNTATHMKDLGDSGEPVCMECITGTKHDEGKPPMSLIPHECLEGIARVLGFGAKKYDVHNWRKGMNWSRVISAAERHLGQFKDGQDLDPESHLPHIDHALCCLIFLRWYMGHRQSFDDRYKE